MAIDDNPDLDPAHLRDSVLRTSWRQRAYLLVSGLTMGIADIIPGVSGGTMALLLGIYDRLVYAVSLIRVGLLLRLARGILLSPLASGRADFVAAWRELPLAFLVPLVGGIALAILTFAHGVRYLLFGLQVPHLLFALFFGLILFSVPLPFRIIRRKTVAVYAIALVAFLFSFWLSGQSGGQLEAPGLAYVFLCGFLAISAMILPGISGAFILLALGIYFTATRHISLFPKGLIAWLGGESFPTESFLFLMMLGLGVVSGLLSFVRVLRWALDRYHDYTMAAVTGLMLGGLRSLWPFKAWPETISKETFYRPLENLAPRWPWEAGAWQIYLLVLAGLVVLWGLEKLPDLILKKENKPAD